jgi:hypothetical protein
MTYCEQSRFGAQPCRDLRTMKLRGPGDSGLDVGTCIGWFAESLNILKDIMPGPRADLMNPLIDPPSRHAHYKHL